MAALVAQGGLTFGQVKADLATVVANGVCVDDPRVLARCNEATKILMDEGIWVGTMATYKVTAVFDVLTLPIELENAIEVEPIEASVNGQTDVVRGLSDCVSNFTYVDPSMAHDNPLVDLFMQPNSGIDSTLRRKYQYPGLQNNALVNVTGCKRWFALTGDSDFLIIQNVPALKLAILSLEFLERGAGSIDDSMKYMQMAVQRLTAEVKRHQMDPRRLMKHKAEFQQDIITYGEGTLGRIRGKLALELSGFLIKGKSEITYLINKAVQLLVDNRNQLAISGRISVHGSVEQLDYLPPIDASSVLSWTDYNDIRLMVQSFLAEGPTPEGLAAAKAFQDQAFESQKLDLILETETKRHTNYTTALTTYVSGTFGWMAARLALEMPGGLAMTVVEIERLISMAEMRLMEQGIWKGCLTTLSATITGGEILFPRDVEAMLSADICGGPVDIRSILFEYQKNGPGKAWDGFALNCFNMWCGSRFVDAGEVFFPETGSRRRKYIYRGSSGQDVSLNAVCKVRWIQKDSCDEMVLKNFEAIRLMSQSIKHEQDKDYKNAAIAQADALMVLEKEMREYLSGIGHVQNVDTESYGFSGLGIPL